MDIQILIFGSKPIYMERNQCNLFRHKVVWDQGLFSFRMMDGWMTCDFTSFSTVFQLYQDDDKMTMNGCAQWNPVYGYRPCIYIHNQEWR